MSEIIIYTNEQCSYCKQIKEELNKNNIEFKEKLTKDWMEKWQEIVNLTGMAMVPTVEYNDEFFIPGRDFQNAQQLINILETFKNSLLISITSSGEYSNFNSKVFILSII